MRIENFKLFENTQQAKSILKKFGVSENNETYLKIKKLLRNNTGYLGFFVKMWLEQEVSYNSLKEFFDTINLPYINLLDKDIITYPTWESLMDATLRAKNEWKYKQILNELPSTQKDLVTDDMKSLFISLYDRKDKVNYLRKISRYKTSDELIKSLKLFLSSNSNVQFDYILRNVKNNDLDIIYSNKNEDIIIVQVESSRELRSIAGDSSWCILDDSTFRGYNNGIYRQFVVFLTDKDDDYKKIGITYGIKMKTAHLLDDSSISSQNLSNILSERGFNLEDLKIDFDKIDFNKTSIKDLKGAGFSKEELLDRKENIGSEKVYDLMDFGFTIEEIIQFKKTFDKQDIHYLPKEIIDKYNLFDKLEIYDLSEIKDKSLSWIIDNLYRMKLSYGKIDIEYFVKINPTPREVKSLIALDPKKYKNAFSDDLIGYLGEIDKPIKDIGFWRYDKEINDVSLKIYTLKYKGMGPQNFDWEDILKLFKDDDIDYLKDIIDYLRPNGWDVDTDNIIQLIQTLKFRSGSVLSTNPLESWFRLLEKFPELKEHVDKIVYYYENRYLKLTKEETEEVRNFLQKNHISIIDYLNIWSKKIDLYPKLKEICNMMEMWKTYNKCLPKYTTGNYNDREIKSTLHSKGIINSTRETITPEIIVEYFYPKLKDEQFYYNTDLLYMIVSLIKTGNIDKLNTLKFTLRLESTRHLIRILFDLEKYNSTPYIREDFKLTEEEREVFCNWLITNKNKINKNYSNEIVDDMDSYRQSALGLIYYYYDWGFQNYFNLAKKFKNQKDKWEIVDGVNSHRLEMDRIDFFKEIFNYQFIIKDSEGFDKLSNKIKTEMILKKGELKKLENSFRSSWLSSSSFDSYIRR